MVFKVLHLDKEVLASCADTMDRSGNNTGYKSQGLDVSIVNTRHWSCSQGEEPALGAMEVQSAVRGTERWVPLPAEREQEISLLVLR